MKYILKSSSGQLVGLIPEYFLELLEASKMSKSSKEGRFRLFNDPVHDSRYPWLVSYKLRCLLRMASANQLPESLSENPDIRQCTALAWSGYLKNIQTVLGGYLARSGSYLCSDGCWPKKRKRISEQREQEDLIISAAQDVIDCRPSATTEQLAKLAETLANAGVPDNGTPAHDAPSHNSPYSMILQLLNVFSQRLAMKIPQRVSARCEAGPSCKKIRL